MDFFGAMALTAAMVFNRNFAAPDYGVDSFAVQVVAPAAMVDTASPVIAVSVKVTPDAGCANARLLIDVDRECAIAVYCDATLTVTGDCDR